jgi:hypothetical protein
MMASDISDNKESTTNLRVCLTQGSRRNKNWSVYSDDYVVREESVHVIREIERCPKVCD